MAAAYGQKESVTLLLERGADIEAKDKVSYADREIHPPHTPHTLSHPIPSHPIPSHPIHTSALP